MPHKSEMVDDLRLAAIEPRLESGAAGIASFVRLESMPCAL